MVGDHRADRGQCAGVCVPVLSFASNCSGFPFEHYFALSLDGLQAGHVWQLLTYQFMHGGFWHIFLNCWAIFVFGRAVETALGKGRMLYPLFP